ESKEESPKLFTTLTTTTRLVRFPHSKRKVMLSDTVGFISRLPAYLVESFRSTLEELRYSDLILLLIDASEDPESIEIKLSSCRETLNDLQVDPEKILLVLNKVDLLQREKSDGMAVEHIFGNQAAVRISAVRGDGLHQLRNQILARTERPRRVSG